MSKAYSKLLKKLDTTPTTNVKIDPQIAALQAKFATIVEDSKKDYLGHNNDDDEEEDEDDIVDEDDEMEDSFDPDGFEGEGIDTDMFNGEGELDDETMMMMASKMGLKLPSHKDNNGDDNDDANDPHSFGDVDEEEQNEDDDDLNIFQYDWDIERDEPDSELDGNDDEDDEGGDNDEQIIGPKEAVSSSKKTLEELSSSQQSNSKNNKRLKDSSNTNTSATTTTTQSLYDEFFNVALTTQQIRQLEAQSAFHPPISETIGLQLRSDNDENSIFMKKMRQVNKYNPLGRRLGDDDDDQDAFEPRQFRLVDNAVLRCGTLIDEYNLSRAQHDYPIDNDEDGDDGDVNYDDLIDYDVNKLTSVQIGTQQLQISSDRCSLGLSPLPIIPPSDSKFPVDQYGDGLIVTAGKQRGRIEKMEKDGSWKRSGYKKSQLQQIKSNSDQIPKMANKRSVQSFKSLGLKARLAEHLSTKALLTPTTYNVIRNSYINYSSDLTQFEFIENRIESIEKNNIVALSKDHGLCLPSYQHDVQSTFSSLLSTYTDCFLSPPIPPPNQQIDWCLYRDVYLVHIINHLLIHRDRIIAHNEAIFRRDARNKEQDFIKQLSHINNASERYKLLEKRLDELSAIMDDDTKTAQEQQDAQARLAVLTHSSKTRLQIKQLQKQFQQEQVRKQQQQQQENDQKSRPTTTMAMTDGDVKKGNKKGQLKKLEKQALLKRQQADLEFQQQISALQMSKERNRLQMRTLDDVSTLDVIDPSSITQIQDKYRDQGFTRPAVLILAPSKLHAYTIISRFLELLPPQQTKKVVNLDKFQREFGDSNAEFTGQTNKPLDYNLNFNGANDDCFRFGIQFNGNGLKLFSSLYSSDLIVASPLGLKLIVGNEGTQPHERKADFLSSIEISVIDQLQLISHQNMDHLSDVLQCLNGFPSKIQNIDFSRIRESTLNGHARFYRQNIWLSGMFTPQLQYLYQTYCENKNGRLRIRPAEYSNISPYFKHPQGLLKQTFYRVDLNTSISSSSRVGSDVIGKKSTAEETIFDRKLHLWFNDIWPKIKDWYQHEGSTVIFIPSSHDFVRIRNIMEEKFVDYCICSEYTDQRLIDSYRTRIALGTAKFILVSERFWVFNRTSFNGIKHIVWYGVPTMPQAYIDFINYIKPPSNPTLKIKSTASSSTATSLQSSTVKNLSATGSSSSTVIKSLTNNMATAKQPTSFVVYSVHDAMALERIVGTGFARQLLTSNENIHVIA